MQRLKQTYHERNCWSVVQVVFSLRLLQLVLCSTDTTPNHKSEVINYE